MWWCGYLRLELGVEQSARDRAFLFHVFLERRPLKSETVSTLAPSFSGTFLEGLGGGRMHEVGPRIHLERVMGNTSEVREIWTTLLLTILSASPNRIVLKKVCTHLHIGPKSIRAPPAHSCRPYYVNDALI